MTKKLSFSLRWTVVFAVLVAFTAYSVGAYVLFSNDNKAYAESINSDKELSIGNHFVSVDESDDDWQEKHKSQLEKRKRICVINQTQLDSLKEAFDATVESVEIKDKEVLVAVVKGKKLNKNDIYRALGIDKSGKTCKLVEQKKTFFIFLVPGVS